MLAKVRFPRRGVAALLLLGTTVGADRVHAQADVAVTKAGPVTVDANQAFSYTITVTNNGPNAATNVVPVDSLPAAGTFVSAVPGGTRSGRRLVWPTVATLAPGASLTYTVTWTAPANPAVPLTLRNLAYSTASSVDPVPANNASTNPAAIVNTAVVALADLATTKTGPATVNAAANYTYTIATRNNGPSAAQAIVVVDTLPPNVTFVSATNGGVLQPGNVVVWPAVASLASGSTFNRSVTVRAPVTGTMLNLAASSSATLDPVPASNDGSDPTARVTTTVNAADVVVTKTGPATVNANASFTYTLTVRNAGPGTATGIVPVDTLPSTVTFVSASGSGVLGPGNVVTWPAIATLANGATTTRTVTVAAPPSGTLLNVAAGTSTSIDSESGNNDGSEAGARVTTTVNTADVVITKTGPVTVNAGASYTYTLTVRNAGPGTATGIAVVDTLPSTVTFVSASGSGVLGAGNVVTWPVIATLNNGASTTRTVTVAAPASGTLLNIAAGASASIDPTPENNDGSAPGARVTTTVNGADLVVTKTGPATVNTGASYTYTLTIRNAGPGTATGIVPIDTLPPTVTFSTASAGGTLGAGNVVTWPVIATLNNGASTTRTVTVIAPATGPLLNIAAGTTLSGDPAPGNNDGSAAGARVTTNVNQADVQTTKTGPATVNPNTNYTYTLTVRNLGPSAAPAVVITDTLPAGVTFVSASNSGTAAANVVTWPTVASLANGASTTRTVTVTAPASGTLLNIAASRAGTNDPDPANNNGSLPAARVTTQVNQPDVATTKTGPGSAALGGAIAYTITVRNQGALPALGVVVSDTLPSGVTFVSATGGGTLTAGVVTWPVIPTLAAGASQTFTLNAVASSAGSHLNVVASTASTGDSNPANNDGSLPAARVTTVVAGIADVVTSQAGPGTVAAGASLTYSITVANQGPTAADNVVVTDTLPAGSVFVNASGGGTLSGNVVTWPAMASLASGASQGYTVTVTAPPTGTLTAIAASTAGTADPVPANNNGSSPAARVTTTVVEQADVVVTMAGPASVSAAASITYTVTVRNAGPSAAAAVVVTDTLPAAVTFVSASGGGTVSGNVVTWPAIASLASGASQAFTVTVTAPASGTLLNIAASTSATSDPDPGNNDGSDAASRVTTAVVELADVATTKTGPATVDAGTSFSYTVTVANAGPSAAAGVVVTDTLPAAAAFVSATGGGVLAGNVVTWPVIASLASGTSEAYTVTVTAPAAGALLNVVASTSTTADPDPANNDGSSPAARVATSVVSSADVATTQVGPARVNAGDVIRYTLTVRNLGPSAANDVQVVDTLPSGTTFISASGGATVSGNEVRWPAIASLASGATATFTVDVRAPMSGTLTSIAASGAVTADPDPANNDGSAAAARVVTQVEPIDLALAKTSPPEFRVGTVGTYTLTVSNVGLAPTIAPITVYDTLASGLAFAAGSGAGWSCTAAEQVVSCSNPGPLAPGATSAVQLGVNVLPAAGPSVTNGATVVTLGDDASTGNNASSVSTVIQAASPLLASKGVRQSEVEIGDVVDYTLTVINQSTSTVPDVSFSDQLPLGFRYQPGSARLNGTAIPDPAGAPGPALAFPVGALAGSGQASITYRAVVGPAATAGDAINRARALSATTGVESNLAAAEVRIVNTTFSNRGFIVGKIFVDCECDPDRTQRRREIGIPGVRVILQDGTSTVTDVEGKYNFYGLSPRMHVVKVDRTTLPRGARLGVTSSRNAGDPGTRFVDLRNSELARADFVEVSHDPAVLEAVIARRAQGEIYTALADTAAVTLPGDSLVPASDMTPSDAFQPLLGGLGSPVSEDNAASPVLRLPAGDNPGGQGTPGGRGPDAGLGAGNPAVQVELQVPAGGVPADGITRIPVAVRVRSATGDSITSIETVTLEASLGRWQVEDLDPGAPGVQARLVNGAGIFPLVASPQEGVGEVRATAGGSAQVGRIAFVPVERPLVMAGLIEGRFDLRSLTKGALVPVTPVDGFEQELTDLSVSGDSGLNKAAARAALYLRGKVKGSYLLTLAFDTEEDPDKQFLRDIQPDDFYPVYGDASVKEFGGQTLDRLYVRVDNGRNYFLYGDFITAPTTQARQLGSYLRSLTGATQRFENRHLQTNAFASRSRITQVVDELPGLGISGPYTLSRSEARLNSERVEIITRDRNQPSRILKVVPLQRFADYTLEAFTGRILLRTPLASVDAQLNPQSLRVAYEVELEDAERFWVYGADAQLRLGNVAEVGGTAVSEEDPFNNRRIFSANLSSRIGRGTELVGEWAMTDTDSLSTGHAARVELRHHSGRFDANAFGGVSDTGFSNPSATFNAGRLELGVRASLGLDDKTRLLGEALQSEDRRTDGRRRGALFAIERRLSRLFRAELGYRWAEEGVVPASPLTDSTASAVPNETNALRARLTGDLPNRKGSAFVEFEQDVTHSDQNRGAVGAEYWLFPRLRLYGRHEFLSSFAGPYALNGAQRLSTTNVGFDLAYFRDGQFFSEYRARDAFAGREAEAVFGLRNRWRVARGVVLDGSFERVNPIRGTGVTEATAVTAGVEYTRNPLWRATARAEYRDAVGGDNFLATLGYARKLSRDFTFLGRGLWNALPDDQRRVRGQLGLAWRETDKNRWNGLARIEHGVDRLLNGPQGELASRQVNVASAHLNYQPLLPLTLSAQYAGKWMRQDDGLETRTTTQLGQLRAIYDVDRHWDVGIQTSGFWQGGFAGWRFGTGAEVGRRIMRNLRLAAGYNVFGFRDRDLRETDYTLRGAYVRFDFKFDETLFDPAAARQEGQP